MSQDNHDTQDDTQDDLQAQIAERVKLVDATYLADAQDVACELREYGVRGIQMQARHGDFVRRYRESLTEAGLDRKSAETHVADAIGVPWSTMQDWITTTDAVAWMSANGLTAELSRFTDGVALRLVYGAPLKGSRKSGDAPAVRSRKDVLRDVLKESGEGNAVTSSHRSYIRKQRGLGGKKPSGVTITRTTLNDDERKAIGQADVTQALLTAVVSQDMRQILTAAIVAGRTFSNLPEGVSEELVQLALNAIAAAALKTVSRGRVKKSA